MRSHVTEAFVACFRRLPARIQQLARKNYRLWRRDPSHPGVRFKRVGVRSPVYAVRVGIGWRALGLRDGEEIIWFWIGSHAEYNRMLRTI